jgi:hypothetical protein
LEPPRLYFKTAKATGLLRKIGQKNGMKVKDSNQQDEYAEQLLIEQTRSGNSDSFAKLVSMDSRSSTAYL